MRASSRPNDVRTLLRSLVPVVVLSGAVILSAPAAEALSCVGAERVVKDAGTAFTGKIVDAEDGRLVVAVEEVWKGGPVAAQVLLDVGLAGWSAWSGGKDRVPDGYSSPQTWLFVPDGDEQPMSVNPCTAYTLDHPGVAEQRPVVLPTPQLTAVASKSDPAELTESANGRWVVGGVVGAGLVLGACLIVVRRRRAG